MKGSAGPQRLAKSETYALFASAVVKQLSTFSVHNHVDRYAHRTGSRRLTRSRVDARTAVAVMWSGRGQGRVEE